MLIKLCVKLFSLPRGLLLPLMLPSCVIGAYAVRLSMLDIWIMFAAGALRYLLREFRFSLAPVVLGVILAPMADENLRRALYIFAEEPPGFVFTQYVGDVLLVVVALIFLEGALRLRRTRHATREGWHERDPARRSVSRPSAAGRSAGSAPRSPATTRASAGSACATSRRSSASA